MTPEEEELFNEEEFLLLSNLAQIERLVAGGRSLQEACQIMDGLESVEGYTARNIAAMEALEKRMLSPEYQERFEAIQSESDPIKKAAMSSQFKRENFEAIDMAAVHRTIASRNRQMKAEGMLPPDAPV